MRRRTRGQSMVEMAFVAPILFVILFAIIDMSWYVYGYMTVYQAARNGAEKAASAPPPRSKVVPSPSNPNADPTNTNAIPDLSDGCVSTILTAVGKGAVMFPDLADPLKNVAFVKISYPEDRLRGSPIEIAIDYKFQSLTPLWNLVTFGTDRGKMHVVVTARRSIENLGDSAALANGSACLP